jgi:hypothetical protein
MDTSSLHALTEEHLDAAGALPAARISSNASDAADRPLRPPPIA